MPADLTAWMEAYLRAWESNDPEEIGSLFSDDAVYRTEPAADGWTGRTAIVDGWLARRDEPGSATFTWQPLVGDGDVKVVTGHTTYSSGEVYDNLWVIRFVDDGRCREFTEWWMQRFAKS